MKQEQKSLRLKSTVTRKKIIEATVGYICLSSVVDPDPHGCIQIRSQEGNNDLQKHKMWKNFMFLSARCFFSEV